ncbi:MAG TPA: hypothetical protein VM513_00570 [Kofleriaceae bacterium]|nr:hypothetical protein [Kofleriaceae bacterium]
MSSFALASALAVALCGGCMKIYSDEELPSLEVTWDTACPADAGDVRIVLYTWGTHEVAAEMKAPCAAGQVLFVDVPREQFRVDGYLLDRAGEVLGANQGWEADLRNGLSERLLSMYFQIANVKIAWEFEEGVSCASLGVSYLSSEIRVRESSTFDHWNPTFCESNPWWAYFPTSTSQIRLRAVGEAGTVAVSEPTPELVLTETARTDAGTLLLRRCDGACP